MCRYRDVRIADSVAAEDDLFALDAALAAWAEGHATDALDLLNGM
ncbi:MAG: hypothetical protein R3C20_21760 [Planctomycetaceae bacterium]